MASMLNRVCQSELWLLIPLTIIGITLYSINGWIKACILAFKLKGPPALPIVGNIMLLRKKDLLTKQVDKLQAYGNLARVWILIFPAFAVKRPEDLQIVLSSRKHTNKIFFYKLLHNFLGNGLITSSGDKWSFHRRLIQPIFHVNTLENFLETFIDASRIFVIRLHQAPRQLNITDLVNQCVIDILNESVLGVPISKENDMSMADSPFRQGKVVMSERITHPWLLLDSIYKFTKTATAEFDQKKKLNTFTRKMIKLRRGAIEKGEVTHRKCLLDLMLEIAENNPSFTDEDIVDEACTFMLAGQDSVGASLAFCLFLLARNSECQQKCVDELDTIFQGNDRPPNMKDIREMRYLEQCIKETLRLYPSVPMIARNISEDMCIDGHIIPANNNVFIFPFATHRMPDIYPNPDKFDPDRFSPEQSEKRHPYAFIPFSAGPRNCIGYKFAYIELKTIISTVLRSFELVPVEGKTEIEPIFRITVRAAGGLYIKFKQREKNKRNE